MVVSSDIVRVAKKVYELVDLMVLYRDSQLDTQRVCMLGCILVENLAETMDVHSEANTVGWRDLTMEVYWAISSGV